VTHLKILKVKNTVKTWAYVPWHLLGCFSVLDIPKRKGKRGKLLEKIYFAPAFEKSTSYSIIKDSFEVEKQRLVFDIYEVSARFARQQLSMMQDSMPGYGTLSIFYKTIEARAIEMRDAYVDSYTREVYIERNDEAYESWRLKIDTLLEQSEEFATTAEECYRFIKGQPIEENYTMAEKVVGNLDKSNE